MKHQSSLSKIMGVDWASGVSRAVEAVVEFGKVLETVAIDEPGTDNPICQKCKLWEGCRHPFMKSDGDDNPEVLVIGEAPGEEEDYKGKPFVGRSGQLLRQVLGELDINSVRFTNVVRCRPPDNKITNQAIRACREFAIRDIERYRPDYVFLMGNSPLNGILSETGITAWNGVKVERDHVTYVPLFHPAYILRNMNAMDEWLDAIAGAMDKRQQRKKLDVYYPTSVPAFEAMVNYLNGCEYISFDVETGDLDPYSNPCLLLSVSFAGGDKAFAYPLEHPECDWDSDLYRTAESATNLILKNHTGKIYGHNIKYDQMHIHKYFNRWIFDAGGDTMVISHLIDSRPGIHGLKRLAGLHLGMFDYDKELVDYVKEHKECDYKRGGSYANVPLAILLPYGAMDAEAALLLHEKIYPELSQAQKTLYHILLKVSDELCRMQSNGIAIDQFIAERYAMIYSLIQDEYMAELLEDKKVKAMIKQRRKDNKRYTFNPNSSQQVGELFFERYKIPVVATTDTGRPSVMAKALRPMEDEYPIIQKVRMYKMMTKMLSTYLLPAGMGRKQGGWLSSDGRVRTTYNLHGTVTGRISSSQPMNLQNIPTPEKEPGTLLETLPIKNVFTHSYVKNSSECIISIGRNGAVYDLEKMYGHGRVVSIDYSGMELRVFASLARCYPMIEIHQSGKDFHTMVATMVTHLPYEQITKPIRYRMKWTNWTLLYGGDAFTLHRMYNLPLIEAEELVEKYFATFPEVPEYAKECITFAQEHGYIESPFGRREHLPYINDANTSKRNSDARAARNMPTQSAASDTLLIALSMIGPALRETYYEHKIVNTVHDSLLLDVPSKNVEVVSAICVDIMENVVGWSKSNYPNLDFNWLISPLKADVDVGSHYGTLDALDLPKQV